MGLTRVLWLFLPFVTLASVWMGVLNARGRYGIPALAPTAFNLVCIAAAFTFRPWAERAFGWPAIYGMAAGAVLGGAAQWLVQVPALRAEGFRFRLRFRDPALRKVLALMAAGAFGLAATQINLIVGSLLAARLGNGAVSWLGYAFRVLQFPLGVFGVAISTVSLSRVSGHAAAGEAEGSARALREGLRLVLVLSVPSAVGLGILSGPIVAVLYERGRFTAEDTRATAAALAGYALGLAAYEAVKVMGPALYALGRARAVVWASAASVAVNLAGGWLLGPRMGVAGLALASALAALFNAAALVWQLRRALKKIDFLDLAACLAAALGASLFMAIIVYLALSFAGLRPFGPIPLTGGWVKANFAGHLLLLFAFMVAGTAAYGFAGRLFGLREIPLFWRLIRQWIQRQRWKRSKRRKGMA